MKQTILVVDDKANVCLLIKEYLTEQHFRVATASNGREGLLVYRHEKPDLILLDIMMPEMDGYEFLRSFRRESNTPVILLTAKLEETDKVIGLELGADDYVTKPFGMRELLARIRAVLRRTQAEGIPLTLLQAQEVCLDPSRRRVTVAETEIDLTPSEFDLLAVLIAAPGRVFTRLDLLETLQGPLMEGAERTIDVHIRNLRCKLEPNPRQPRYIQTVFGVGYRFADSILQG